MGQGQHLLSSPVCSLSSTSNQQTPTQMWVNPSERDKKRVRSLQLQKPPVCHHFSIHPHSSAGKVQRVTGELHTFPGEKQPWCSIRGTNPPQSICTGSWEEEQPLPAPHMIRCSLSIIIKTRQMCVDLVRCPRRKPAPVALFSNLAILMEAGLAQSLPIRMIPSQHHVRALGHL